ncbi:hypothetical protein COT48_01065 [Candidatus Woesearchaeota archaeon CG08_land_8_20_14_0_20_47_9]|nr:MAG: hypothetical protein COV22_04485 [Candidatus Woesearchaeota archaeon CG10_big_fil_rev_8_21_14_0_10_47_5]PIO04318.1 MAG: hypothetical protein COT48_01065 [Candidatus Woesearchaeota archaeon CG08_land_8_20_14_0_20_47_9]HII29540.1 DUF2283 domain-containing protein [Candidatus Woesearchaeota archaeon]
MRIRYDPEADVMYIALIEDEVAKTKEVDDYLTVRFKSSHC